VGGNYGGTVTHCYSTGPVSGRQDVGGLVGISGGGIGGGVTDSFWDTQTSGQTTSAGGTGKTTAEMQTATTFLEAGWDFVDETANGTEDTWRILEGQDYPRLWWESVNTRPPQPPAEGNVIELTEATFDQVVLNSDVPVLVDFWAPWCGPCLTMAPVIEEIANEYAGRAKVCKLNTYNAPNIIARYNVTLIPTFILFKNGQIQQRWIGITPKQDLTAGIDAVL
jgi:thioredoxin 1